MQLRKCKTCGKEFIPRTKKHKFCCRKCFIIAYRRESKIVRFPSFICPKCHKTTELKFNPIQNPKKWERFKCPYCKFCKKDEIEKCENKIENLKKIYKIVYS